GTQVDAVAYNDDVVVNVVNGASFNQSSVEFLGSNLVSNVFRQFGATAHGPRPSIADPHLGSLSLYFGSAGTNTNAMPAMPIGASSPAYDGAPNCLEADQSTVLMVDGRSQSRPKFSQCDIGAYEYDGDYIFADGYQPNL